MKYGLPDRALNTLETLFKKYSGITKVTLYGSRAMGNYKNGSDIDITLEVDDTFSDRDLLRLSGEFDESDLPYFVDCSLYRDLNNQELRDHINRMGKVIYARRDTRLKNMTKKKVFAFDLGKASVGYCVREGFDIREVSSEWMNDDSEC